MSKFTTGPGVSPRSGDRTGVPRAMHEWELPEWAGHQISDLKPYFTAQAWAHRPTFISSDYNVGAAATQRALGRV